MPRLAPPQRNGTKCMDGQAQPSTRPKVSSPAATLCTLPTHFLFRDQGCNKGTRNTLCAFRCGLLRAGPPNFEKKRRGQESKQDELQDAGSATRATQYGACLQTVFVHPVLCYVSLGAVSTSTYVVDTCEGSDGRGRESHWRLPTVD